MKVSTSTLASQFRYSTRRPQSSSSICWAGVGAVSHFPPPETFNISHISILRQFLQEFIWQNKTTFSDAGGVRQYLGSHHGDWDVRPDRPRVGLLLPAGHLLAGLLLDGLVSVPPPFLSHRGAHAGGLRCESHHLSGSVLLRNRNISRLIWSSFWTSWGSSCRSSRRTALPMWPKWGE